MRYFVWLTIMLCAAGCSEMSSDANQGDAIQSDAAQGSITSRAVNLQETTFLEFLSDADGADVPHRFVTITDTDGFVWQGVAFNNGSEQMILQQMQSGGKTAVAYSASELDFLTEKLFMAGPMLDRHNVAQTTSPPDAEITFVRAKLSGDTWTFSVAVDHSDTGWEDYTDGWHVETPDGEILTTRILIHPHVGERPFTRSSSGFTIPADVTTVHVRSHDLISGYSTETVAIPIAEAGSGDRYEVVRD